MNNMKFYRKLPIPLEVKRRFPITERMQRIKAARDEAIANIFGGKDDRLLLIIGPCSADDPDAVFEYLSRLKRLSDEVSDRIFVIPRVYTGKPRTTGDGYKGMIHQPDPNMHSDMFRGIIAVRSLHMTALRDYDMSAADEMLYPENHRYLSDLLSYTVVGARSVEDQQHRLTASGLSIPVGMKNPVSGDISVMLNAIRTSRHGHTFIYRGWEVESNGNMLTHGVLRGYRNGEKDIRNCDEHHIAQTLDAFNEYGIQNPSVIVDVNHSNSGKDCFKQVDNALDVIKLRKQSQPFKSFVKGLMIESYLEDGSQAVSGGVFGCSITDPCLGWDKTAKLVRQIADML